jgi:hypothetical protein
MFKPSREGSRFKGEGAQLLLEGACGVLDSKKEHLGPIVKSESLSRDIVFQKWNLKPWTKSVSSHSLCVGTASLPTWALQREAYLCGTGGVWIAGERAGICSPWSRQVSII